MIRFLAFTCLATVATGFAPVSIPQNVVVGPKSSTWSSLSVTTLSSRMGSSLAAVSSGEKRNVDKSTKIYGPASKETPKVLGGVKIGLRKLVVVTGASSGLGLACAETLAKSGKYFVVMACRDVEKGKRGVSAMNIVCHCMSLECHDGSLLVCSFILSFVVDSCQGKGYA
jgi:protochlorophyllide reductase